MANTNPVPAELKMHPKYEFSEEQKALDKAFKNVVEWVNDHLDTGYIAVYKPFWVSEADQAPGFISLEKKK